MKNKVYWVICICPLWLFLSNCVDKFNAHLPELIKIRTVPEGWEKLRRLIVNDKNFQGNKGAILRIIDREQEPDRREWLIKSQYKTEYAYMLDKLYPAVRRVDFLFSLSRRGMRQDTLYTNEPDTMYAQRSLFPL